MCGIAGVLRFDGGTPSRAELIRMSRALVHRGPDGAGHEVLGPCGLAHRRLSIIDLSEAGRQPMQTEDGALWIAHNGEVYNYVELREQLQSLGHRFRSGTDTEVILAAYREWGTAAFERFNGMWGLAIWDQRERRLVLSRDRVGIKPLYVHRDGRRLRFASEIKALLAAEPELARLDHRSVSRFLQRPALSQGRETFFEGIEAVDPGHILVIDADGSMRAEPFWDFRPPRFPLAVSATDAAEQVKALLTDAVRLRFRSDVEVGTCLSGGLDSSSIVSIAGKTLGKAPRTFSAIYREAGFDESRFVRIMTDELGLSGTEISPDGSDMRDVLERATWYQESPTGGAGIYSQWHVMKAAAKEVTVLLDGQGGDELFAGYHRHYTPYFRSLVDRGARGDLAALREAWWARPQIKDTTGRDPALEVLGYARGRLEKLLGRPPPAGGAGPSPLSPSLVEAWSPASERRGFERHTGDALTDTLWDTLVRTSIPVLLHYEDRDSMAHSLEARTPFLDHRLIEYAFSLPTRYKIRGDHTKLVLRDAMRGLLPEAVRDRRDKLGYPTPFSVWLDGPEGAWVRELILGERTLARGFVQADGVRALLDAHLAGRQDHGPAIYRLTTLELFCRRFIDGPLEPEPPPSHAKLDDAP